MENSTGPSPHAHLKRAIGGHLVLTISLKVEGGAVAEKKMTGCCFILFNMMVNLLLGRYLQELKLNSSSG